MEPCLKMKYTELQEGELFGFFGIEETGRFDEDGLTRLALKTGGYQESIDITLWVDAGDIVRRAQLSLDRNWIGNAQRVNPFGKDIAKSFLATFVTFEQSPYAPGIVQGLWQLTGTSDQVTYFNPEDAPKPIEDPVILSALDVYVNNSEEFELSSPSADIRFYNGRLDGADRFFLDITYK